MLEYYKEKKCQFKATYFLTNNITSMCKRSRERGGRGGGNFGI